MTCLTPLQDWAKEYSGDMSKNPKTKRADYWCKSCQKIVKRNADRKQNRMPRKMESFCESTGKDSVIFMLKRGWAGDWLNKFMQKP